MSDGRKDADEPSPSDSRVSRSSSTASLSRAALSAEDFAASGFQPARVAAASTHSVESCESPEAPVFRSVMTSEMPTMAPGSLMPSLDMPLDAPGMEDMLGMMPSLAATTSVPGASLGVGMGLGLGLDVGFQPPAFGSPDDLGKPSLSSLSQVGAASQQKTALGQALQQQQQELPALPGYAQKNQTLYMKRTFSETQEFLRQFAQTHDGSLHAATSSMCDDEWNCFDDEEEAQFMSEAPAAPKFVLSVNEHTQASRVAITVYAAPMKASVNTQQDCCIELSRLPCCSSWEIVQVKKMLQASLKGIEAPVALGGMDVDDDELFNEVHVDEQMLQQVERCMRQSADLRPQLCKTLCFLSSQVSVEEAPLLNACVDRSSKLCPQVRQQLAGARENLGTLMAF